MSDDEETGETPDFLTHKELSDYREAFGKCQCYAIRVPK